MGWCSIVSLPNCGNSSRDILGTHRPQKPDGEEIVLSYRMGSWIEFQSPRKSHISVLIEKARMSLCAITTMTCQCGHPCQGTPGYMVQDVDKQLQRKDIPGTWTSWPPNPAFRRLWPTVPAENSKFVSGVEKLKGQVQLLALSFVQTPEGLASFFNLVLALVPS